MKSTFTSLLALAAVATALPSQMAKRACTSAVSLDASTNVWESYTLHPNSFYRAEVVAAAANISDSTLAAKALEVADIGTFLWLDSIANIDKLTTELANGVPCENIFGLVIYDLPGRDCAAKASNGELAAGDVSTYKTSYIDRE